MSTPPPATSEQVVEVDMATLDTGRLLTVPNGFTMCRLALIPVFAWLVVATPWRWQATVLLVVLGVTDFVDGWFARHFGQVSRLGEVLDPMADRLLVCAAVGCTLWVGAAPKWLGVAVLVRELAVAVGAVAMLSLGGNRLAVRPAGKVAAFALMVAFPAFLASTTPALGDPAVFRSLAWVATAVGLAFGYSSLVGYVSVAWVSLRRDPL